MKSFFGKKDKANHNEILIPKQNIVRNKKWEDGGFFKRFLHKNHAILTVLGWYLFFSILGGILLYIPIFQKDDIEHVSFINSLFISSSAFSDTGLSTVSVSDTYNFFWSINNFNFNFNWGSWLIYN